VEEAVRQALAHDRTVDITTIGRRSGVPRRIEIWFYRAAGRFYLSGSPGKRDWYANLEANPALTFHLKRSVVADLPATARLVTDEDERRRVFTEIVGDLNQPGNPAGLSRQVDLEAWMAGSPLVEITFVE
jgi:deazaflavin-dependent oxidoreductase (nitroreductase family)